MAVKAFVLKVDTCDWDSIVGSFVAVDHNNNTVGEQPRWFNIGGARYSDTGVGLRSKVIAAIRAELGDPFATVVFFGDLISL